MALKKLQHALSCDTESQVLTVMRNMSLENIVGKEANPGNQHFLLFPRCIFILSKTNTVNSHEEYVFRNTVGKGANPGNQHLLFFPRCFVFYPVKDKYC